MKDSRKGRIAKTVLVAVIATLGIGIASAKVSERSCANALLASITPLSVEHPLVSPEIQTKIIAPFMVRASTKIPLLAGHMKYHNQTYIAFFGWIRQQDSVEIYLL